MHKRLCSSNDYLFYTIISITKRPFPTPLFLKKKSQIREKVCFFFSNPCQIKCRTHSKIVTVNSIKKKGTGKNIPHLSYNQLSLDMALHHHSAAINTHCPWATSEKEQQLQTQSICTYTFTQHNELVTVCHRSV